MNTAIKLIIAIINSYWYLFLFSALFFLGIQNALTSLLGLPTFIDEILQAMMLASIIVSAIKNKQARFVLVFFGLTVFCMLLLSYPALSHRGLSNVFQQVYVHSKYIIYIGFVFLFIPQKMLNVIISIFMVLSVVFLLIDFILPGMSNELFDQRIQKRGGMVRPIGIQAHTAPLGYFMAFISAFYFFQIKGNFVTKGALMALLLLLVFATTVRTALVVFPILLLWGFRESIKKSILTISLISILALGIGTGRYLEEVIDITQQNIQDTIENPTEAAYIRGMMLFFSFELATDRFPIGTGAATFGSVKSDDSQIYAELGVQNSRFFVEKDGIYDSNFATILGEFGYIGMIAYYLSFAYFSYKLYRFSGREISQGFLFVGVLLVFAYSVTNPVFMNTYQIYLYGLLLVGCRQSKIDKVAQAD
jgi:hypothetical protein